MVVLPILPGHNWHIVYSHYRPQLIAFSVEFSVNLLLCCYHPTKHSNHCT